MAGNTKQRSQGGGRTSNSEPRLQVFRDFAGCNFQESPHDFTLGVDQDRFEQSDLQMNYVVIQNNVAVASNKTLETRKPIIRLLTAPDGKKFTRTCLNSERYFFIAVEDIERYDIYYANLINLIPGTQISDKVNIINKTGSLHHFNSFCQFDNKLIATTQEQELWTGDIDRLEISNTIEVPDPSAPDMSNLVSHGALKISEEYSDECCFRIAVAYSYVNKFGPTCCSEQFTFYANYPVSEWHGDCFLTVKGNAPVGYEIQAVEIYYTVDNSSSLVFAGRTDFENQDGGAWEFAWIGYLDVTSMWPIANLIAPTENYTVGPPCSDVTCIDGRMYFWGGQSIHQGYRLYIGGNPGNLFSIASGTGGGFVDVEPGTGQNIRAVKKYKTQSGNSIVTLLCDSPNSTKEQRFNLVENSITISNEQSMKSWQAEQVAGSVGCKSEHGAEVCADGLYSVSRYGLALTTMTMEYNSQIQVNYVSDAIKPVFTDGYNYDFRSSYILYLDGIIYLCFCDERGDDGNIIFCYDISLKSWWTYTLDTDEQIIGLTHIDYQQHIEGVGIITPNHVYLLPTAAYKDSGPVDVLIETGELANQMPQQGWQYLSQLEFRFDRFVGDIDIELIGIDIFGRRVNTKKHISHIHEQYDLAEYMRVDLKLQSYKLIITGKADFRMTHFMAKCYVLSNKVGMVWGFNDSQSFRSFGDIHPTFNNYNDIRRAIIP